MRVPSVLECVWAPVSLIKLLFFCLHSNRALCRFLSASLLIYSLTFLLVLPLLLRDRPLTKYFKLSNDRHAVLKQAKILNGKYADQAEANLAHLPTDLTKQRYEESSKNEDLQFVIAVMTVSSRGSSDRSPRYLTQVLLALHEALEISQGLQDTTVFICNSAAKLESHHEAVKLSQYFPMVHVSRKPTFDSYDHEKQDYAACLSAAHKFSSKYVVMLQDDALPHPDFYSVMKRVLRNKIDNQICRGEPCGSTDDWLWLKLNFPNSLAFYERNYFFALEWVSICTVVATVVSLLLSVCCKCNIMIVGKEGSSNGMKQPHPWIVFLTIFAYFMLLTWVIGKPYITLPKTLSESLYTLGPGTSCCLPAVLYPSSKIPGILTHLDDHKSNENNPLDFILDDYRQKTSLRQYLINPNLFSHIGIVSALHGQMSNTRVAENYYFVMQDLKRRFPWFYGDP